MAQAEQSTDKVTQLSLEQFPIVVGGATERRAETFLKSIAAVNTGLANGEIMNPVFTEAKDWINRAVDEAYDRHVQHRFRVHEQPQDVQDLSWSFLIMGLHDCKSAGKKIRASKATGPMVDAMKEFIDEVEPLWKALDALKPLVVKRKILTSEEREARERYIPPATSTNGIAEVQAVLQAVTDKKYVELVQIFKLHFLRNVAAFEAATEEGRLKIIRNYNDRAGVYEAGDGGLKGQPYVRKPDFDQILEGMAEREAKQIRDQFIFKNLKKLCSVVEKKGNLDRVEECDSSVSLSGLKGSLRVRFKDGATFVATNSVVWSHSVYGKLFSRFPLTFHDVLLADGSKMPRPSEERMNTVFAASAAPADEESVAASPKRTSSPGMG